MIKKQLLFLSIFLSINTLFGQTIKLNQIGFYPTADKIAILPGSGAITCKVVDEKGTELQSFTTTAGAAYAASNETVRICDFSAFTKPGRYKLVAEGGLESYYFDIHPSVHLEIAKGSIRALYYNRASSAIEADFGGTYIRPAGHPDVSVQVHTSAASAARPAGTILSAPKGWYDAGDFNKYVVNAGITTFTVLATYEHYSDFYNMLDLRIPESGNTLPDILDEALWELDWMLAMQDPNDGGVYHKLTTLNFSGTVMPDKDNATRYMVGKSTSAALNFAAVMAVASRIFKNFDVQKPGFSQKCLDASKAAWAWAKANPTVYFANPGDVRTGPYDDTNVNDEFDWAASELFITTGDETYLTSENVLSNPVYLPDWKTVYGLQWVSLGWHKDSLNATDKQTVINKITSFADGLYNTHASSAYRMAMTQGSFYWGSNAVAANQGLMLLQAYEVTKDEKYLDAAVSTLDYLLGRNPTGYCFVTGTGTKSPRSPHHRVSTADGIPGPIPGFLVGGPNNGREDGCSYPSTLPALSYTDTECSWASNEVAINWNAALIYLAGGVEATLGNKPEAPAILIHPTDQAAQAGQNVAFTVFASGNNLMYQWQKNGEDINGATSETLPLNAVSAADQASYRVLVYTTTDTVISRKVTFKLQVKAPFGGTRHPIPGKVEGENYDEGGQGVGYFDNSSGNNGGAHRTDDVDVGGNSVGWTASGEWLNYSVNVTQSGSYRLEVRTASPNAASNSGRIDFLVDGVALASNIALPATGSWNTFQSAYVYNINLTEGDHDFRILIKSAGFNLDYFVISDATSVFDKKGAGITLYPNPSAESFTISLDAVKPGATLILSSIDGKEVVNRLVTETKFSFGENLEKGFYLGRIVEEDRVRVFEVVKF